MRLETAQVKELHPDQKANWIPGMPELCWKHLLHSNIEQAKSLYGEEPFSFWPRGWNLPEEYDQLKAHYDAMGEEQTPIILKPSMQACGNGIRCVTSIHQLPRDDPFLQIKSVAQYYIPNPLLLDGFKVTFRIYVLLSSVAPLRAYIFPNGLGRICSHRYTTDVSSFQDLFAHLTNYDINKHNIADFLENQGDGMSKAGLQTDGLRTDFCTVMDYLRKQGRDVDGLWERMKLATAKTLLAVDSKVSRISSSLVKYRATTFEILGFDFLIDEDMNPWILEVNHAPNLEPHTDLETELKRSMIRDALRLVDLPMESPPLVSSLANTISELNTQLKALGRSIDDLLRFHDSFGQEHTFPISTLSPVEIWTLVEAQLESERVGQWQTVFPLKSADETCSLNNINTGSSEKIYTSGFGGRRNDLSVQFLQLGIPIETIIERMKELLAQPVE